MYSSEDLERFNFQYQTESLPSGEDVKKNYRIEDEKGAVEQGNLLTQPYKL